MKRAMPGCKRCGHEMSTKRPVRLKGRYLGVEVDVEMDGYECPAEGCGFATIDGRDMPLFRAKVCAAFADYAVDGRVTAEQVPRSAVFYLCSACMDYRMQRKRESGGRPRCVTCKGPTRKMSFGEWTQALREHRKQVSTT